MCKLPAASVFSCIENGRTDPSFSTLDRIAKAIGISLSELFAEGEIPEVVSHDKSIMEKVSLMESLPETERQTLYTMLDAFVGKRRLKDALSDGLNGLNKIVEKFLIGLIVHFSDL